MDKLREQLITLMEEYHYQTLASKDIHDITFKVLNLFKQRGYLSPEEYAEIIQELSDIQVEVKKSLIENEREKFKQRVEGLEVIDYEKLRIMTGLSFSDKVKLDIDDVLEAELQDCKDKLKVMMGE